MPNWSNTHYGTTFKTKGLKNNNCKYAEGYGIPLKGIFEGKW